jgi:hypothetical protein
MWSAWARQHIRDGVLTVKQQKAGTTLVRYLHGLAQWLKIPLAVLSWLCNH